jgi:hypothetical protein
VLQMLMTMIIMIILRRKFCCYKSIQQGIRVRVFVGEVLIKRLSHSSEYRLFCNCTNMYALVFLIRYSKILRLILSTS